MNVSIVKQFSNQEKVIAACIVHTELYLAHQFKKTKTVVKYYEKNNI